jgi:hypothetical protein
MHTTNQNIAKANPSDLCKQCKMLYQPIPILVDFFYFDNFCYDIDPNFDLKIEQATPYSGLEQGPGQ